MRQRIAIPLIGLAAALALVTPAEAADNGVSSGATTTSIKVTDTAKVVTATTIVSGPDTTPKPASDTDDDDDSDKTGLWGLVGLLGLAGLAGLKKRNEPTGTTTTRPVTGTAPPRADGATGTR